MNFLIFYQETTVWKEYVRIGSTRGKNEPEKLFNCLIKYLNLFLGEDKTKYFLQQEKKFVENVHDSLNDRFPGNEFDEERWKRKRIEEAHCSSAALIIQFDAGVEINCSIKDFQVYKNFKEKWSWWIIVYNDLYSLGREIMFDQVRGNLAYIRMKFKGMTADESISSLLDEGKLLKLEIEKLGLILKENANDHFILYIDNLILYIKGLHHWFSSCERYKNLND